MPGELHGRPTAAELVEAVHEFLEGTLSAEVGSEHAFHLKVAINALGMVARELRQPAGAEADHADRLAALGVSSDAELAGLIRGGSVGSEELARIHRAVLADVEARLAISNPSFVERYRP